MAACWYVLLAKSLAEHIGRDLEGREMGKGFAWEMGALVWQEMGVSWTLCPWQKPDCLAKGHSTVCGGRERRVSRKSFAVGLC